MIRCCAYLCGTLLGLGPGCDEKEKHPVSPRSSTRVQLPDTPDLTRPPRPLQHPDGVLTVEGVLRQRDQWLGKPVKVRGSVAELRVCPAALAAVDAAAPVVDPPPCNPPPSATLTDSGGSPRFRLLVAGSMLSELTGLRLGETTTLEGQLLMLSPDRKYLSQAGLLYLPDRPPPPPPPAPDAAPSPD
jgi:hypothetical protein